MVVRLFLSKLGYFKLKKKMLKFFLNQKICLLSKSFFFFQFWSLSNAFYFRKIWEMFFCFKKFFFKCFFFQFKIFSYLQNEFCDNKICRQGTLGSQLKIFNRLCHKTQHLLIFDDFGQKTKKSCFSKNLSSKSDVTTSNDHRFMNFLR